MASVCRKSFGFIFDLNFAILNGCSLFSSRWPNFECLEQQTMIMVECCGYFMILKSFQTCYLYGKVMNGLRVAPMIFHTAKYI